MALDCSITQQLLRRQQAMFLAAANAGISQKIVHHATGLSLSIIGQYARGETAMGGAAMLKIRKAVGAELFSMLLDDGDHLIEASTDTNHADLAAGCIAYAATYAAARHPDSPAGTDISPCEDEDLKGQAERLKVV